MQGSRAFFTIAVFAGTLARPQLCNAQARPYFGAVGGVSTLSADASTAINAGSAAASSYKPENGPSVGGFGGLHWTNYFSVQVDYVWNRNLLTVDSLAASTTGANTKLFEETLRTRQQSALGSALLYFRPRSSWVRPFLSLGTGVVHLTADPRSGGTVSGLSPPGRFSATEPALHVAVGIDLKFKNGWGFRYSFAETSSANPISRQLTPPGSRMLANFRNLFGVVKYF